MKLNIHTMCADKNVFNVSSWFNAFQYCAHFFVFVYFWILVSFHHRNERDEPTKNVQLLKFVAWGWGWVGFKGKFGWLVGLVIYTFNILTDVLKKISLFLPLLFYRKNI